MDNQNIYTEYNDKRNRIPWLRMILTALIIILLIFIVLFIIKNCSRTSLRGDFIKIAESYYNKYEERLPKEVGECSILTLATLESEGLIDSDKYSTCDKTKTYVNVCHLENQKYNYAATLSCDVEVTNYGMWKDGTISDLKEGSDVRFRFTGEQYKLVPDIENSTKIYYPSNESDASKVNSYYSSIPSKDYTFQEEQTIGYKWYKEVDEKTYWNNGQYSAVAPSGYINKDSQSQITKYSIEKPEAASYRTINTTTLYRYKKVVTPYSFVCIIPGSDGSTAITSPYHCALNESGFTQTKEVYYSCDGGKTTTKDYKQTCSDYTEWSNEVCVSSVTEGIQCESAQGYKYTDVVYKWYKNTLTRNYYPSGSKVSSGENTYYVSAPVDGAIKDVSTETEVYKYYKYDSYNMVEKWERVTEEYIDLDSMISSFNSLGYDVNNLTDINAIENIRYQYKMQYRNVEE